MFSFRGALVNFPLRSDVRHERVISYMKKIGSSPGLLRNLALANMNRSGGEDLAFYPLGLTQGGLSSLSLSMRIQDKSCQRRELLLCGLQHLAVLHVL